MKILVYNFKGGQGKTSIAMNLAMTMGLNFLTNELFSPVQEVLPEGQFLKLGIGEECPILPNDVDVVFDFGGSVDLRVGEALKQVDYVLVPVINSYLELYTTIQYIQEIEQINNNIIIIANETQKTKNKDDFEEISKMINENYPQYPIFKIKKSEAMKHIFTDKMSIAEMVSMGGLKKYNYQNIKDQFDNLIKELK